MKIGLALGAGAARGLAHIGVIEVLKENNIKIDFIAGTSMGALVGAYLAVHGEIDSLKELAYKLRRKDLFRLVDFAPKMHAIIKGEKIHLYIDKLLEGKTFSETQIPLNIIATDLCKGKEVILSKGRVSDAVRASIGVPAIFLPSKISGKMLVDGGLVNSTPVDVVKKMGADMVIAVDLPFVKLTKTPNIFETLMQSYEIMREGTIRKTRKTIVIRPVFTEKFTGLRFLNKEYVELGRKAALQEIKKIKVLIKNTKGRQT